MPNRSYTAGSQFRYGFNGQESSNEVSNNSTTAEFWQYDSRIARRWNLDPRPDISESPYSSFKCNPVLFSDVLGDTSVLGAGGKIQIEIDEKYNKLEFYDDVEYAIGRTLVPVRKGQLRSFTNVLGHFTARWTKNADGKYEFVGYLNEEGKTIEKAVEDVNSLINWDAEVRSFVYNKLTGFMPREGESYEEAGRRTAYDLLLFGVTSAVYPEPGFETGSGRFSTSLDDMSGIGLVNPATNLAAKTSTPLYHYTTAAGYNAIMNSKVLNPSIGVKNARFGSGQYFTDIVPGAFTKGQTSYRLYGVPWNSSRLTHYIKIETSGLNIIQNKPFNFLNPSSTPLNLNGRILGGGATGF